MDSPTIRKVNREFLSLLERISKLDAIQILEHLEAHQDETTDIKSVILEVGGKQSSSYQTLRALEKLGLITHEHGEIKISTLGTTILNGLFQQGDAIKGMLDDLFFEEFAKRNMLTPEQIQSLRE